VPQVTRASEGGQDDGDIEISWTVSRLAKLQADMALRRLDHNRSKAAGDKLKQENLYSETQANELKRTQDTLSGKGSM